MRLLKSFSLYTIVGFLGAGINFLLMPLLSHHLTPEDYGLSSIINTYVSLLSPLVSLVAYGIISVDYYKITDKIEFASLFSSVQIIPVLPTLFLLLASVSFYHQLAPLLELPPGEIWVGVVIFLLSLFIIYIETANAYLVIAKKTKWYALFTIARVLCEAALTVWLVVFLKKGWQGRILSWAITSLLFAIVSFGIFYKEKLLTLNIKKQYIYAGLAYGAPLISHTIGKFIINQSDRIFIAKMVSLGEAGIYNIGYTIGMVLMLLVTAFNNVFLPYLMECLVNINEEKKLQIVRLSYIFILAMLGALLCINLFSPFLFSILIDKRYAQGASYVFWVSLGYVFWGGYLLFSGYIYFYKQTKILFWLSLVNIISNLVFNYVFIKHYGGIGAAYATALSFFIVFISVVYKSGQLIKLPWSRGLKSLLRFAKQ
jgi:O-antigen/teichoic acid export membrane protein